MNRPVWLNQIPPGRSRHEYQMTPAILRRLRFFARWRLLGCLNEVGFGFRQPLPTGLGHERLLVFEVRVKAAVGPIDLSHQIGDADPLDPFSTKLAYRFLHNARVSALFFCF